MARNDFNKKNNPPDENDQDKHLPEGEDAKMEQLRQELKKEKNEALKMSKKLKAELSGEIEDTESQKDTQDIEEFMHQGENHETRQEVPENQHTHLQEMFQEIETDNVEYPIIQKLFPNFIKIGEQARLGRNIPIDVVFLAAGIAESLLSVVRLGGHIIADVGRLIVQPRDSYRETVDALKQ